MSLAKVVIQDEVNVQVRGVDMETLDDVVKAMSFHVPKFMFSPKYKLGRWDGKISLAKPSGKTYLHLVDRVEPILRASGYSIHIDDLRPEISFAPGAIDDQFLADCLVKGEPIVLRDYQVAAINAAFENGFGVLQLATGAGKTLICAAMAKRFLDLGKVLIIVPSIDLAIQTVAVFKGVGVDCGIWYGELKEMKNCIVSTWQSLEQTPELFHDVQAVIVDEAHQAKAKVLNELLCGPGARVPFRFGVTGTVPKEELYRLQLEAALGPVIFELPSWELQQRGVLAKSKINMVKLGDSVNPSWQTAVHEDWIDEVTWIASERDRVDYIASFIREVSKTGNTLVLTYYRVLGDALAEALGTDYYDGRTGSKKRVSRYTEIDGQDNEILVASMGIASTGIDIPRLYHVVFVEPGKALIKTMQAIGRGLRKSKGGNGLAAKEEITLWDFHGDDGLTKNHAAERKRIYKDAHHEVEVIEVDYYNVHSE